MQTSHILEPIADHVWRTRYCWYEPGRVPEPSIEASWERVALAVSKAETHHRDEWRERFRTILHDFRFLPGGLIPAVAGTPDMVGNGLKDVAGLHDAPSG
jgi:ribonucleoside-diphosphate reductase alpha chain